MVNKHNGHPIHKFSKNNKQTLNYGLAKLACTKLFSGIYFLGSMGIGKLRWLKKNWETTNLCITQLERQNIYNNV